MARKLILIVDDDKDWLKVVTFRLEHAGYQVEVALDTISGVAQAFKVRPDLILLDIMMPGGGGIKVLQSVRNNTKTFNIPVIIASAGTDIEAKESAKKLGISAYFVKPVNATKLMEEIEKALEYK